MTRRLYGKLQHQENPSRWVMSDVPPHVALRLKAMFLRIPKGETKRFTFPDTVEGCADLEWFTKRYPMEISAEDHGWLQRGRLDFEIQRDETERILLPGWEPPPFIGFKDGKAPYAYQLQAIALARKLKRLLLLDEVGSGKTITALGTVLTPEFLPCAVVCEPHLADQWKEEFVEEFTSLRPHIIKGTKPYDLPPADVYIFRYSNIFGWVDIAAQRIFKSVVFDEIQQLRHGDGTAKGQAARVFADNAILRMGLSATPIYNYGTETYPIVDLIEPGFLGDLGDFYREWVAGKLVKDPDALGTYLREHHIALRRTDEEIGQDQPPANVLPISVPYDETVEADELAFARTLALKVLGGTFQERGQAARELDLFARRVTGLAKAKHVAAYVRMLLEAGTPVLLAGWHRDVYDIWLDALGSFRPAMYTGSEPFKHKNCSKKAFMSGETDLLIISLRSGAGLDGLQHRCSTLVIGELDWSPQVHKQLVGRLRRPGQTKPVDAIYLHADGGSDPLIIATLGLKADQQRRIIDPLSGAEPVYSDDSRIKALARMYLDKSEGLPMAHAPLFANVVNLKAVETARPVE